MIVLDKLIDRNMVDRLYHSLYNLKLSDYKPPLSVVYKTSEPKSKGWTLSLLDDLITFNSIGHQKPPNLFQRLLLKILFSAKFTYH